MSPIMPNLNYIKKIADGNMSIEKKLLAIVKKEFPNEKKQLEQHLLDKKFDKAALTVHKLKHKFVVLGFESKYELITNFEKQLLYSNITLLPQFTDLLSQLETFIKKL